MAKPQYKIIIILAFIAIYVIWGSTYLLNKIIVGEVSPLYLGAIRFISAGILIFIISKILKYNLVVSQRQLINSVIAGFLFLTYGNGVFVWALKYVDSGFAALLASTQPIFVLLLMRLLYQQKILPKAIIGVVLGVLGMVLLVNQQGLNLHENSLVGILMIFSCVLSWSYASVFVAKNEMPVNYFVSTGYQMISGGIMLLLASLLLGEDWLPPNLWSTASVWSMILLVIFGSIVAFTSFNYLLKVVSTEKVSTSAYVNPVIALILGWYILDEKLSFQSIIAALILLTGVYFINRKKRIFK
ncbi:DMT family transporter [Namhaeicola litoreus]|uniref:DMT family transporter n=1 Tax=Namhaeicola litoreus TaxID=1052145 RepID=A0ABW3Y632_9FLAO